MNLVRASSGQDVSKLVESSEHRLVVILYISKYRDCLSVLSALEKSAQSHKLAMFCVIDVDTFAGDCIFLPYLKDTHTIPRLDCLYRSKSIGTMGNVSESRVEDFVITGEGYIAKQVQSNYGSSFQEQQPGLPTLKQMQYMFHAFQLMQQMGLLKPVQPSETAITLDNGDRVIPLPDGRFKLIRKQ